MKYKDALAFTKLLRHNQTPAEKFFWNKVRDRRLFNAKFRRQFLIEHAEILGKKYFYIVDFYCFEKKLIVELDGEIHLSQKEYDAHRHQKLIDMGFQVIRFRNEEVLNNWNGVKKELEVFFV